MIKTSQNIIGTDLLSISNISEVKCLHRTQRILIDNTDTEASPSVPPDNRAASLLDVS